MTDDAAVNKVIEIKKLVVGKQRNINQFAACCFKVFIIQVVERILCEEDYSTGLIGCRCYLVMHFLCSANMVKRKKIEMRSSSLLSMKIEQLSISCEIGVVNCGAQMMNVECCLFYLAEQN